MSLTHLLKSYDAIGVYPPRLDVTLDLGFTGSSRLVSMFQSAFEQEALTLTCTSLERAPGGESLRLKGTAHLLGLENAAVDFLATERDGDLLVTLAVTLPSGWRFSTSFPDLPDDYDPLEPDEEQRVKPSFLDELSLGASTLVFSTQKHSSETYGADLLPGLNFVGELYFLGALMGLRTLTGKEGPVRLSGPVREYRERPDPLEFLGLRLRGPIELTAGDWPIPLSNPELFIKSPVDFLQVDHTLGFTQEPGIYLSADARIAGRPARLISRYARQEGSLVLSFLGKMTDFALAGFSSLSQELGGDDVQAQMPEELRAPEGLRLTEFGITLDFTALQVLSVQAGLGCDTHWELVPDKLVLEEIGLSLQVLSPFSKGRSLSVALSAQVAIQDVKLAVFTELPSLRFGGGLTLGEMLPLGKVLESCCTQAPELPEMTVTQLVFEANPQQKTFALNCAMDDVLSLPVGATSFEVLGMGLAVDYARGGGSTGAFTAEMGIAGATAVVSGELADVFTLTGSLQKLDLREFWSLVSGGEQLPEEIPDTVLENLTVSVSPKSGDFSLRGSATVDWDGLTGGAPLSTQVQFAFSRDATGSGATRVSAIKASLSLQGSGSARIAEGFTLETFHLLFDYQTGTGWKLSGGATAEVLGNELRLQAGYETGTAGRKLKLQALAKPEATLIDLEGVGSYRFSQFDLTLDRRSVPGAKARTFFDLRVGSTLELKGLARVGGYLCLANTAEGASTLVFKPTAQSAAFSLDFPTGEGAGVRVELVELGFLQEAGSKGWSFTGTTYVGFTGIPSWLGEALPSRVFGKLVVGKNNARISALNVTDPIDFTLPTVDGKKLGKAVVQLTELGVSLKPEPGLVVETGVGIPAELNTALFGGRQVFRVYQPGNLLSMARTRFTLSGTGIALQFLSSPFAGANAVVIQGESWFDVDLGEYGALQLKMPTFVYDGVTQYFEAGGGCKVTRPLALPLEPLKSFLTACGLEAAADIFPDKLPVTEVSLVDKDNNLQVDALVSFLQRTGKFVPKEVVTALKKTGKLLDRFPDGFKQYLSIEVPQHLEFKFGFSPTGRVSLALLAPKKPVRVLFPSVVQSYVPMPGLTGIEVRKLTVGTLLSGSLFYAEVDAVIDQFDLPSLAVSLMLPSDPSFPLPTSDQLQRRIILDDVFCIVPLSQGLPIPLPVFYDELGFQYLGVEGLGLQTHVSFPKPALDGSSAIAFFTALKQFISDRTTLLDPQRPPGGLDLAFTFRDEYLLAPEYLGGGVLGTQGKEFKIGLWKYVASMMNFCKRFSINDFIGAIPLEQRVGSAKYKFAFLKFDADWLLTTPGEFKKGAFERLKLSAGDRDDFMTVLPSVGSTPGQDPKSNEEGLVAFVRGKADLDFARLEAAFGLAASGAMGFNTGFKLAGAFGKTELELSGAVRVNAPKTSWVNRAVSFNGKNTWIEIPASDNLLLPQYTIELWLKSPRDQSGDWVDLFGVDTRQGALWRNHYLAINSRHAFYHHRFTDASGGNAGAPNTPNDSVQWGRWQHVAMTNDGVTAKTYVDGKEAASGPVNGKLVLFKDRLFIGKTPTIKNASFWKGELAEVRIWKRARGQAELESQMRERLEGDEKDLVSLYRFDEDTGQRVVDIRGRNHGTLTNGSFVESDLAGSLARTAEPARPALQLQGHTHLTVAGHQVMRGDLRLVDDQFWFAGQLDLFPKEWPLQVTGHVEGWVSKQRFQLSGETRNALFGLTLSQSRLLMSNEQLQLEGKWLGASLRLDVSWDKNDPVFAGSVGFSASPRLEFGVIRIAGVKVADNFRLSVDIAANVSLVVNRKGLAGDVTAKFKINGTGFELRVGFDVAPSDVAQLFKPIEQKLIAAPEKYLAHLFSDAGTWLKNVTNGTLEFAKDSGEAVGTALSSAFKVSKEAATSMMKGAGYAADQVGAALNKGYNLAAREATRLLKDAGYAADQVGAALNKAYNLGAQEATAVLKDTGYAVEDVGKALESAYKTSAEDATKLLKQVGYDVKDITKALNSAFGKVGGDCENLLKSAGFSSNDITGVVNSAGKELKKTGKTIKKGIKSIL